jgi:hypothetical protein
MRSSSESSVEAAIAIDPLLIVAYIWRETNQRSVVILEEFMHRERWGEKPTFNTKRTMFA